MEGVCGIFEVLKVVREYKKVKKRWGTWIMNASLQDADDFSQLMTNEYSGRKFAFTKAMAYVSEAGGIPNGK